MTLPGARNAEWAAKEYVRWLPRGLSGLLRVEQDDDGSARFYLRGLRTPLLVLTHAADRSTADRQLFFVTDGLLVAKGSKGRFELRQVLEGRTLFTAIFDFAPSLPWWLYRATQARVHAWVMASFARHLARQR